MIFMQGILSLSVLLMICLQVLPAQSATYYISPTGSDTNPGTSARPWLTFAYAINPSRATCGDTLVLRDGTYGDGTSTGKILVSALVCTQGSPFTIQAENQRKAKIVDNGIGKAVNVVDSAFIVVDGLYARSTDNNATTTGGPFIANRSADIMLKNLVGRNPNRYANAHVFAIENSNRVLIEDSEGYVFHRHCVEAWKSSQVVARRIYCNPRGGRIPGGFAAKNGIGLADAVMTMYPCRDCIQENNIADGTTNGLYLNEMNATFGGGVLMSGSKVLGSICYKCNYGNGIYLNSRNNAGLNYTPHNITVRDVAFIDHDTYGMAVRVSDGVNIVLDHLTGLSDPAVGIIQNGIITDDNPGKGTMAADNSITVTNTLMAGYSSFGFRMSGFDTWIVDRTISHQNGRAFSPSSTSSSPTRTLSNTMTTSTHNMGTCKVWVPDGASGKGKGIGGSDIGATILYRYVNGVLTTVPLWDPRTGEFPYGAEDADGTNRVPGESLFDIHKRLNVNTGGCSFPKNYGDGNSDTKGPASPVLRIF